jgi:hypothetical protein
MKRKATTTIAPSTVEPEQKRPKGAHGVRGGTSPANRLAAVILEVLAGECSPTEAAASLEVSLPRYYQLETRALEGMVVALEPRPKGKQPSLAGRVAQLEKQLQQAHRESARQQALVRVTQRTLGLATSPPATKDSQRRDRPGRKKRCPTVRALKAARTLRARPGSDEPPAPVSVVLPLEPVAQVPAGSDDIQSLQPMAPAGGAGEVLPCPA